MKLIHYAEKPVTLDRARAYPQDRRPAGPFTKPEGLWVSVEGSDDWKSWCEAEEFSLYRLAVPHQVTLSDEANILVISDADAMEKFTAEYGREWGGHLLKPPLKDTAWEKSIDWTEITQRHDGIIIAPYQWSCRMSLSWYYGWDAASGCIWNLDAIADFSAQEVSA